MTSQLTDDFIKCFRKLPGRVQKSARKSYQLWKENPHHQSLEFKRIHRKKPVYSVRVGIGWRALGIKHYNSIIWFWIGSHSEYDNLLKEL